MTADDAAMGLAAGRILRRGRYTLLRFLGSGAFGSVYLARDHDRGTTVALKFLKNRAPEEVEKFRNEFRAVARIAHPNLVALDELVIDESLLYYSMEFVSGGDLLQFIRTLPPHDSWPAFRASILQLCQGLKALHESGKIHGDVKPSNVLVSELDRRVVLLDFGMVRDASGLNDDVQLAGTLQYMAPEQIVGLAASATADWYSLGALMFECLTGQTPFAGTPLDCLRSKQAGAWRPLRCDLHGAPAHVQQLCLDLMHPNAARRPGFEHIAQMLTAETVSVDRTHAKRRLEMDLVGRSEELRVLCDALAAARACTRVTVRVRGPSGIGKTALIRHFLADVGDAAVFAAKCFERELVPFKAIDGIVASLRQLLRAAGSDDLARADLDLTSTVFQGLLHSFAGGSDSVDQGHKLRARATKSLANLIRRICPEGRPIVIHLDDAQWADEDSASVLADLMDQLDARGVLLIVSHRDEVVESSFLMKLEGSEGRHYWDHDLALGALAIDAAAMLAESAAVQNGVELDAPALAIESKGHPLVLLELARSPSSSSENASRRRYEDLLIERFERLSTVARSAVEVLAVAGEPIHPAVVCRVIDLDDNQVQIIHDLCSHEWARAIGVGFERIVTFHDRIRDTLLILLPRPRQIELHARLARVLKTRADSGASSIAAHFDAAGDAAAAAEFYRLAALEAGRRVAFKHAVLLLERARALTPDAEAYEITLDLARAQVNAGLGSQAAQTLLLLAARAPAREALEFRREAAERLIQSGHLEEGVSLLAELLGQCGVKIAATPFQAAATIALNRILAPWLDKIGRSRVSDSHEQRFRIDACWAGLTGLGMTEVVRAAALQTKHLRYARASGEPYRLSRALSLEAAFAATNGRRVEPEVASHLADSARMARASGNLHAVALTELAGGLASWSFARWAACTRHMETALKLLESHCHGTAWERDTAVLIMFDSLIYRGKWREMMEMLPERLQDASARGDIYAEITLQVRSKFIERLARNDADGAAAALRASDRWTRQASIARLGQAHGSAELALFQGDGLRAHRELVARWPEMRRSLLLTNQAFRIQNLHLRARCATAAARASGPTSTARREYLAAARKDIARLRRERVAWADALALLVEGALLKIEEKAADGVLLQAAAALGGEDLGMYAAAARMLCGARGEREKGASFVRDAGVVDPARLGAMLTGIAN